MKLLWTARAESDLNEIFDHVAEDSPDRAYRWVSRLRQRARSAAGMPLAGRKVPERDSLREVIEGNYRIVCRRELLDQKGCQVLGEGNAVVNHTTRWRGPYTPTRMTGMPRRCVSGRSRANRGKPGVLDGLELIGFVNVGHEEEDLRARSTRRL